MEQMRALLAMRIHEHRPDILIVKKLFQKLEERHFQQVCRRLPLLDYHGLALVAESVDQYFFHLLKLLLNIALRSFLAVIDQ
jgi:hypothetical protein